MGRRSAPLPERLPARRTVRPDPARDGPPCTGEFAALTTGAGLWLYVVGGASVEWVHEPYRDSVLLELRAGRNLVSWTGRDGVPAARAFARLRAPFVRASRWNAEARRSEEYRYGRSIAENTLLELRRGDAFWVELTSDARWWQPGAAPSPVEFLGDVPAAVQDRIRRWVDETQAVFAELWGIETDFASYVGDLDSITPTYASVWGGPPREDFCGGYGLLLRRSSNSSAAFPATRKTAIRSEYGRVRTFFAQRFGAETPRFTAYVGADAEAVKATHLRVFGEPPAVGFCEHSIRGVAAIVVLTCGDPPLHNLDRHYFDAVRAQSAPWESLPPVPVGHNRLGPNWLLLATEHYAEYAYRQGLGVQETLDRIRQEHVSLAAQTEATLHSMETRRGVDAAGYWGMYGLTQLAAERLVRRAGEPALFSYYRALPDAADWREAFEAAFGIRAEAFYEDFEAYRAEIAPPGG